MKKTFLIVFKNLGILLFFICFGYIKWRYFYSLSAFVHFFLDLGAFCFTYLIAQPVWLQSFQAIRRWMIYIVMGIAFILSFLWNVEYVVLEQGLGINLYFIPVLLSTMLLSIQSGFFLTGISMLSYILIQVLFSGFSWQFIVEGLLIFFTFTITVVIVGQVMKHRDQVSNKHNILIQHSKSLVLAVNREGKIDLCNPKMKDFLQLNEKKIMNQFFWEVEKETGYVDLFQYLYPNSRDLPSELHIDRNGRKYYFLAETYHLQDDGLLSGSILVLTDITGQKELEHKLKEMARTDELTGLYNRRYFEEKFQEEILRSSRYDHSLSFMILDVDHFKQVNDGFGHDVGDEVLIKLSSVLEETIRKTDVCARWGGEEFVILLPETNIEEAMMISDRIHEQVREISISVGERLIEPTISIGLVARRTELDMEGMIKEADQSLYKAKENGRNQTWIDLNCRKMLK